MTTNNNTGHFGGLVGFKNPPKNGQFKKGTSGNLKGKKKGVKNFRTDLLDELHTKIEISEGGKKVKITKQKALIKRMINGALNGDIRATNTLVPLILDFSGSEDVKNNSKPLTEQELNILKNFLTDDDDL